MIKVKRINNENVAPVKFVDVVDDPRPVRGRDIFPEIYSNIFFCARKKSGKTCAIAHIIDKCSTTETRVIAFVSTLQKDPTWRAIEDLCHRRKIDFTGYTSIKDEGTKEDILKSIVDTLKKTTGEEKEEEPKSQRGRGIITDDDDDPKLGKKAKKPKELAPRIIFIFDDLSGELHTPSFTEFLKMNRHFKCKVLISSQYWNDVSLQARKQINYVLLYRGLSKSMNKLRDIYDNCDLSISFELFVELYRFATKDKFHFLYIDVDNSEFRKDFSHKVELSELEGNDL